MADFLSRLAERVLGTGETVQPRLAPLFANGADLSDEGRVDEEAPRVLPRKEAPATPRVMPAAAPNPAAAAESVPAESKERPAPREDNTSIERRSVAREELASLLPPRDIRPARRIEPPPAGTSTVDAVRQTQPLLPPERRAALIRSSASPAPVVAGLPPRPSPGERAPTVGGRAEARATEAAPTVRVTIGRVEVRAVFPAAPPSRVALPPPGPTLTLEEYLEQRREGER